MSLELIGTAPHCKKYFAHQIFGRRSVTNKAQREPIDAQLISSEQRPHCALVSLRDQVDQFDVY
jgi:hypothetical protein